MAEGGTLEAMKHLILAATLLISAPLVHAQWTVHSSVDAMTDRTRTMAFAKATPGYAVSLYRVADGPLVLMLTTQRDLGVPPFEPGPATIRVDREPLVEVARGSIIYRAFSAVIEVWDPSRQSEPPPIVRQLRQGRRLLIRLPHIDGTRRTVEASIGGDLAVDRVMGYSSGPGPLTGAASAAPTDEELRELECEAAVDRTACLKSAR